MVDGPRGQTTVSAPPAVVLVSNPDTVPAVIQHQSMGEMIAQNQMLTPVPAILLIVQ